MRLLLFIIFLFSLSLFTATKPIEIGVIYNLTGSQSTLDRPSLKGVEIALNEINKQGGVLGRVLKLSVKNGQTKPEVIKKIAADFADNPNINFVIGLSDTDMVLAAAPKITEAKKMFFTSGATSPYLVKSFPKFLFLATFTDDKQAEALARFAREDLKAKKTWILTDNEMTYTKLLSKFFKEKYTKFGGEIILDRFIPHEGQKNISWLEKINSENASPDIIFLAADPQAAADQILAIRQAGYNQPILGGDSLDSVVVRNANGNNDMYRVDHGFISIDNKDTLVQRFIQKYQTELSNEPDLSFVALGYDTLNMLVAAIKKANSLNPQLVAKGLRTLDYHGITGQIKFSGKTAPTKKAYVVKVMNSHETLVKKINSH